jgi:hypothetical protein
MLRGSRGAVLYFLARLGMRLDCAGSGPWTGAERAWEVGLSQIGVAVAVFGLTSASAPGKCVLSMKRETSSA